jgi:2-polyprenyl-3-methyl-5-hydroxy-6-metoxy-1,4-benzoquinol methylase
MVTEAEIAKGKAVYSSFMLKLYDVLVLDISNRWIWRCHKNKQLAQFNQGVRANHLDIGVGTGYYLQACRSPALSKLSLMDLNPNCLEKSSALLKRRGIKPAVYLADIYKPQPKLAGKFDSISMNYLLHCLPGDMGTKEQCIANAAAMLRAEGILFGATILSDEGLQTKTSRSLMGFYNKKGIFSNQHDSLAALEKALNKHLINVQVSVIGCVALFSGSKA